MRTKTFFAKLFFLFFFLFFNYCSLFLVKDPLVKQNETQIRICFWNVKNLSIKGLNRHEKGSYILRYSQSCDAIVYLEVRSAGIDMAKAFEEAFIESGSKYACEEGIAKGEEEGTRKEKYLACIKSEWADTFGKLEYADEDNDFARPPTFFFFQFQGNKFLLVPFHSTPKDKEELRNFQKVIDYAFKNFSDRKIFFGGDFNTGSNYQKVEFLITLPYFLYLEQLIKEPTTFANQHHDLIFTDKFVAQFCKGKVWRLDELFPEVEGRKKLEKISDHFPISADCKFK